jgi:hypothetical protein
MKHVSVVGIHVDEHILIARLMKKFDGNGLQIAVTHLAKLYAGFVELVQNITAASPQHGDKVR